jgi:hypothetical protein
MANIGLIIFSRTRAATQAKVPGTPSSPPSGFLLDDGYREIETTPAVAEGQKRANRIFLKIPRTCPEI